MKSMCKAASDQNRLASFSAVRLLRALRSFALFPSRSQPRRPLQQQPLSDFSKPHDSSIIPSLTPQTTSPLHDPPSSLSASSSPRQPPPPLTLSPLPAPRVGFPYRLPTEIIFLVADQCTDAGLSNKQIWSILAYATDRETLQEGKRQKSRKAWLRKMDCERSESNKLYKELDIGMVEEGDGS